MHRAETLVLLNATLLSLEHAMFSAFDNYLTLEIMYPSIAPAHRQ